MPEPSTALTPTGTPTGTGRVVEPYEARGLSIPDTVEARAAATDACTAVNGFYYPGERSDAILTVLAWLRTQPEACAALGLGSSAAPALPATAAASTMPATNPACPECATALTAAYEGGDSFWECPGCGRDFEVHHIARLAQEGAGRG